ncbi:choline kinase family protein [Romboutsia sp.]|uniref:choline kinase family protein n=1 Tax=Romboutsia sp. TaxID=1965302 RepID=UPI002BC16F1A|nr:choline kinase family protein [Romboutsia sp.]HSQ89567.1 choline kinase family protein [Romboutsia sp.]
MKKYDIKENILVFVEAIQSYEIPDFIKLVNLAQTEFSKEVSNIEIMSGGLTNKNFKIITTDNTSIVIRIAGKGTAKYINRPAEKHNASLMASMGIAPEIYYYDPKTGSQICEFIEADTMHPEDFINNPEIVIKAAEVMGRYHNSGIKFKNEFSPIVKIKEYLEILKGNSFDKRYDDWDKIAEKVEQIERSYKNNPPKLVPCHNDTIAENFMYDGKAMYIVDWEYGGMNDRFYDIACVCVENPLPKDKEELYLHTYFGKKPTEEQRARLIINKLLVNAHWSMWSLVQIIYGKEHDFYWEYGRTRAVDCIEIINDPNFNSYIKIINDPNFESFNNIWGNSLK